ncbi:MAG TPA: hypothetical protein VIX58_10925 [Anaerolineae bacterium]
MTIALASAWHPRGELARFLASRDKVGELYAPIVVSVPPHTTGDVVTALEHADVTVVVTRDWTEGRHAALLKILDTDATHVHYIDFDRLLHWLELYPEELKNTVARVERCDCLIVGRTPRAYRTHPRALVETEAISNLVTSHLLGHALDFSAGSKGFSRRAVECLRASSPPGRAMGVDAEWPLLLQRAGFTIEYLEAEGLEWESADHFASQAADELGQQRAAEKYDADPAHWARRIEVALEIIQAGLDVARRNG